MHSYKKINMGTYKIRVRQIIGFPFGKPPLKIGFLLLFPL